MWVSVIWLAEVSHSGTNQEWIPVSVILLLSMKCSIALIVALFAAAVVSQNGCDLEGPYTCTGGSINAIEFGRSLDSSFFKYYSSAGSGSSSCSFVQEGEWDSSSSSSTIDITLETGSSSCKITGEASSGCSCQRSLKFVASDNCVTLTGPNGEVCKPASTCSDDFKCPNGARPVQKPDYTPGANGCGPASILTAPRFSFLSCCEQHDF